MNIGCFLVKSFPQFLFKKKNTITQFTINTVYTLLRTYNVTSSTTFVPFLVCTTCLRFTAFTLLTTPEHYLQYTLTLTLS